MGRLLESDLERALMDKLQQFLLELGKGFAFVGRQQRISTETQDFYIDLVFYNYLLKCFVLIDLKSGHLTHQDIGQMDMYVRLYDDLRRSESDNPTVGILLCGSKDRKRVAKEAGKNLAQMDETPRDFVRDPVMLEFLGMPHTGSLLESKLEDALIGNLQAFLLELGKGFAFVARQQRIST